jgi:hypothetical protein
VKIFLKSLLTFDYQDLDLKNTNTSKGIIENQSRLSWKCNFDDERVDEKYQRQNFVLLSRLSYKPKSN